jgi:hypothetical protein
MASWANHSNLKKSLLSASIGILNEVLQEELDGHAAELVCEWAEAPLEIGGS